MRPRGAMARAGHGMSSPSQPAAAGSFHSRLEARLSPRHRHDPVYMTPYRPDAPAEGPRDGFVGGAGRQQAEQVFVTVGEELLLIVGRGSLVERYGLVPHGSNSSERASSSEDGCTR